jgi:RNA polymerase sigma-70 factor (sigma-E family)
VRRRLRDPSRTSAGSGPNRDEEFSRFAAARVSVLRSTAYLLCGDWHHAEDITQAALLKLYLAWPRLEHHGGLDAYSRRIVVRTFLAERRRVWRRREQLHSRPPDTEAIPDGDTDQSIMVRAALSAVPARQRAVLVLRYWNDLSVEETATVLGCSTGNVKSQAARGLAKLRQRLDTDLVDMWSDSGRGVRRNA